MKAKRASLADLKLHQLGTLSLFLCFFFIMSNVLKGGQANYLNHHLVYDYTLVLILFYLFTAVGISFIGLYSKRFDKSNFVMILLGAIVLISYLIMVG